MPGLLRAFGFGAGADLRMDVGPALGDAFAILVRNKAERGMLELDQRAAVDFGEAILHVVHHRIRHKERAVHFEQPRRLNGLNVSPKMPSAFAEIAVPASAGPGLDLHGHGSTVGLRARRADLFEQRRESDVEGRLDADLLVDVESVIRSAHCSGSHTSSFYFRVVQDGFPFDALRSARSFTEAS